VLWTRPNADEAWQVNRSCIPTGQSAVAYLVVPTVCGAETLQVKEQHVTENY